MFYVSLYQLSCKIQKWMYITVDFYVYTVYVATYLENVYLKLLKELPQIAGRQADFVSMILTYKAIRSFYYVLNYKLSKISTHYIYCMYYTILFGCPKLFLLC